LSKNGIYIKTFGCQMNVYDSQRMADVLKPLGFVDTDSPDGAELILVNTCHIREKAAEKLFSELGRYRQIKEERERGGERTLIAVAGCVAQAEGEEILRRAPFVDIVVGPQTYHRLPEMVSKLGVERTPQIDIDFAPEAKFDQLPANEARGPSAFLSIQEGCDKFCTFCVVPYTRGAEYSRPLADVIAEARNLAHGGVREITLLGQNVNAYHGDAGGKPANFAELIRRVADIEGIERIRYTTSHPIDMDDDLIAAHGELTQLMPFLHLPVQSGSDSMLRRMNRHHRVDLYRSIVEKLLRARPDLKLSTDFIVGFPGETDEEFQATLSFAREIGFVQAYSFKYSARPGTPATILPGQISEALKSERLAALQQVLEANQRTFNESCVGRVMPILFDRQGRHPGQMIGRSPYMQPVHASVPTHTSGEILNVCIVSAHTISLGGELVPPILDSTPSATQRGASA
jgi:tRNA-2-methylthio-N6-dimethylallyladenosine synthase